MVLFYVTQGGSANVACQLVKNEIPCNCWQWAGLGFVDEEKRQLNI